MTAAIIPRVARPDKTGTQLVYYEMLQDPAAMQIQATFLLWSFP
jgi:hypothetical protein